MAEVTEYVVVFVFLFVFVFVWCMIAGQERATKCLKYDTFSHCQCLWIREAIIHQKHSFFFNMVQGGGGGGQTHVKKILLKILYNSKGLFWHKRLFKGRQLEMSQIESKIV